jgi:formate dehydrogenase subunit gamma
VTKHASTTDPAPRRAVRAGARVVALTVALVASLASAQQPATPAPAAPAAATVADAPAGPPPGFVVPAEPKADDTNAQRAKSQPGNNSPLWRDVRNSGSEPGFTTLPGLE